MEWCGLEMTACVDAIASSRAVSAPREPVDVFWLTHAKAVPPALQCAHVVEMAAKFNDSGVYMGSDWYDGSHIVCNDSATGA